MPQTLAFRRTLFMRAVSEIVTFCECSAQAAPWEQKTGLAFIKEMQQLAQNELLAHNLEMCTLLLNALTRLQEGSTEAALSFFGALDHEDDRLFYMLIEAAHALHM